MSKQNDILEIISLLMLLCVLILTVLIYKEVLITNDPLGSVIMLTYSYVLLSLSFSLSFIVPEERIYELTIIMSGVLVFVSFMIFILLLTTI